MLGPAFFRMMHTLVSMVRGINVGGNRPLRMEKLRAIHEALGFRNVRTYLQSGNVVFEAAKADADRHGEALEKRILRDCGLEVAVGVRTSAQMTAALEGNPFVGRPSIDPKFLHATFLVRSSGKGSLEGVSMPFAKGEAALLLGDIVYVYCPSGYGNSKINNTFFERKLSERATTRNWQTVTALERMARGEDA
jgi:uncharacterized protein (DUF1697 family)